MKTGRFKVLSNLTEWFAEKRGYHSKNGLILKRNDDLMDATCTAVMMRRFAANEPRKVSFGMPAAGGWLG
jgi:terminase large subunit-like protein